MVITEWQGCYDDGWQGDIVPEAFTHPAKFSRGLIHRIYKHAKEMGWIKPGDTVLDPFGGVALGGLDAMSMGLNWIGVELEEKFVKLGEENIELWRRELAGWPNLGTARIVRGDSRHLKDVINGASLIVSSPPYAETPISIQGADKEQKFNKAYREYKKTGDYKKFQEQMSENANNAGYGHTPGNLANMKEGDIDLICSSPPYSDIDKGYGHRPNRWNKVKDNPNFKGRTHWENTSDRPNEYGTSPGQLGAMKEGSFDLCVSSPPYSEIASGAGGLNTKPPKHSGQQSGRNPKSSSQDTDQHYGKTEGQLSGMPEGSFDLIASSPPYDEGLGHGMRKVRPIDVKKKIHMAGGVLSYGESEGQLAGASTFWAASREIVQGCFDLLKPGGHAIWVCKDYVKAKKRVPFSDRWLSLCESVGFTLVCRHQATLVKEHGTQMTSYGDEKITTERKSFFRRLAESKGSPRIDFENVICMVKK